MQKGFLNLRYGWNFLILILPIIFMLVFIHLYWLDGITGAFFELFIGNTEYSEGYSELKFRRIHREMTESQVMEVLGNPLFKNKSSNSNKIAWFYSYGKRLNDKPKYVTDSDYSERVIIFENGKVIDIYHGFYFN